MPVDKVVLAMAFDWIAKDVYMLCRNRSSLRLELLRVLIYDTDSFTTAFPLLEESAQSMFSSFQLVVNPFTGSVVYRSLHVQWNLCYHPLYTSQ